MGESIPKHLGKDNRHRTTMTATTSIVLAITVDPP